MPRRDIAGSELESLRRTGSPGTGHKLRRGAVEVKAAEPGEGCRGREIELVHYVLYGIFRIGARVGDILAKALLQPLSGVHAELLLETPQERAAAHAGSLGHGVHGINLGMVVYYVLEPGQALYHRIEKGDELVHGIVHLEIQENLLMLKKMEVGAAYPGLETGVQQAVVVRERVLHADRGHVEPVVIAPGNEMPEMELVTAVPDLVEGHVNYPCLGNGRPGDGELAGAHDHVTLPVGLRAVDPAHEGNLS